MQLLLTMTLAGSIPFLVYLVIFHFMGSRLDSKYYILFLKMSIVCYLCPFQLVKYSLPLASFEKLSYFGNTLNKITNITHSIYVRESDGFYIPIPRYLIILYIIFVICVSILFIYTYQGYRKEKYLLLAGSTQLEENLNYFLESHPEMDKLKKKKFRIYEHEYTNTPFVIGLFSPYIVFPSYDFTDKEKAYIYSHELTHISHHDTFWKTLCVIVSILHCYNPLVYLLLKEFSYTCEYYCDESCTSNLTKEEKKDYTRLIVHLATENEEKSALLKFANTFTGGKKFMKKRIDFIFKETKMTKVRQVLAIFLLCFTFLLSSSTVFAYSEPIKFSKPLDSNQETEQIDVSFIGQDSNSSYNVNTTNLDFSKSSRIFIAEDGTSFSLTDENMIQPRGCSHTYVSGTVVQHEKYSKGCTVKLYNGKRCSRCGATIVGSLISTHTYATCPH